MGIIEFATSPWGQDVPIHIAFGLIWVAAIGGLAFLIGHAIWAMIFARKTETIIPPDDPREFFTDEMMKTAQRVKAGIPEMVPRHSLAARLFHWIMSA